MQATMKATIATVKQTLCVQVKGPIDIDTSPALREQVMRAWTAAHLRLELDFAQVDYISSPGIALLLEFRHTLARQDAAVSLTSASPQVREVLATCRLDAMFLPDDNGGTTVPAAG